MLITKKIFKLQKLHLISSAKFIWWKMSAKSPQISPFWITKIWWYKYKNFVSVGVNPNAPVEKSNGSYLYFLSFPV